MNYFNLTLSGKHFIYPSILSDSFARQSNLGCRSLLFTSLNTSCQSLLACKVSFEKSADSLMGTPLQVTVSFSLTSFRILSLSLILGNNYDVPWCFPPLVQLLWENLSFLDFLEVYFLHQIGEVFFHYFSNKFLIYCSFSSPSSSPMIQMLVHLKLSQRLLSLSLFWGDYFFFLLF